MWGVDSHGVLRLTHYLRRMTLGSIKAAAAPVVMRTGPVTAQVHGEDGLGIVHAALAMEVAIEMARENGVGVVGVGTPPIAVRWASTPAWRRRRGYIGIALTHSSSIVVPHGGREKYFGTNPISIAIPRASGEPVCLDMATRRSPGTRCSTRASRASRSMTASPWTSAAFPPPTPKPHAPASRWAAPSMATKATGSRW